MVFVISEGNNSFMKSTVPIKKWPQKLLSEKQRKNKMEINTDANVPKSLRDTDTSSLSSSPKNMNRWTVADFIRLKKLGAGKFGKVYLVM